MKTGKTPYEIRLDLLTLSFDILQEQRKADALKNMDEHWVAVETTDILAEAEKLNAFVSQS